VRRRTAVLLVALLTTDLLAAGGLASPAAASSDAVTVAPSFFGLNEAEAGYRYPPDVQVAVGPTRVLEMVNVGGAIWTKAGRRVRTFTLATFFGATAGDRLTDPRVLYDPLSRRWFAAILDLSARSTRLAVSLGTDPAAIWKTWAIPWGFAPGACLDEPMLGTADTLLVLAANVYASSVCPPKSLPLPLGGKIWAIDKARLVVAKSPVWKAFGPDPRLFGATPAQALGPTGTAYLGSIDPLSPSTLHLLSLAGSVRPSLAVVRRNLAIDPVAIPPEAVQAGSAVPIDTGLGRVLDAAWMDGTLSLAMNDACTPPGDTTPRACARVVQVKTANPKVMMSQELSSSGGDVFYPALRPDAAGNLAVVYGHSSADEYPGVAVRYLRADGTWTAPAAEVAVGTAPEISGRYGDYFGAAVDPLDGGRIWLAGEFGPAADAPHLGWRTVIVAARLGPAPAQARMTPSP